MSELYFILLLASLVPVLALSFDKKVAYFRTWKYVVPSILVVGAPFILWDEWFTTMGVWGFNTEYLTGLFIGHLPLEELLFFIVVPFSSYFIYACIKVYVKERLARRIADIFYPLFLLFLLFILATGLGKWYSMCSGLLAVLILLVIYLRQRSYPYLPLAFLLTIIPFLIINGALTGSFSEEPVVWYNPQEFSGYRIFSIPVEDISYCWILLVLVVLLADFIQKKVYRDVL